MDVSDLRFVSRLVLRDHQPQQSVLKRHSGQRHTACIRNISAPQRSHTTASWLLGRDCAGVFGGVGAAFSGSGMA